MRRIAICFAILLCCKQAKPAVTTALPGQDSTLLGQLVSEQAALRSRVDFLEQRVAELTGAIDAAPKKTSSSPRNPAQINTPNGTLTVHGAGANELVAKSGSFTVQDLHGQATGGSADQSERAAPDNPNPLEQLNKQLETIKAKQHQEAQTLDTLEKMR